MSTSSDLIVIRSVDRSSGSTSSSDFTVNLDENVIGTYEFVGFTMVNPLYNCVTGVNDKIYITHSVDGANTLTITEGFYNQTTLAVELKTQLDSISAVAYTITYNTDQGTYTITPDSGTILFSWGTNTTASARKLLGFSAVDGTTAASQTSNQVLDFLLYDGLYVKIGQDNNHHVTLSGGAEASISISFDENIAFRDIIQYKPNKVFNQYVKFSSSISALDFTLYYSDGSVANLRGVEWCCQIKKIF